MPLEALQTTDSRQWFEHDNPAADGAIIPPPYTSSREHYRLHGSELGHALWENTADRLSRNTTEHNPRRRRRSVSTVSEHDPGDFPCSRDHEQLRQHLAKRRRLDPDSTPVALPPIKYGYYGQVVPGQLKMMVISCDGGELEDPTSPMMYLGPQNILKHDRSVYCSTRKEASIILRHADDTPFSLTTLDILGPPSGFQTRFQRGCAYVSMDLSSLSEHTVKPEEPWPSGALCTPTGAPIDWALVLNRNGEDAADMVGEMHTVTLCDATDIPEEEKTDQRWTEYLAARTRAARRPHVDRARWRSRQLNRTLPYNNDFSFFTQPPVPAAVVDDPHDNAADTIDDTDTADEASVPGSRDIAHAATQTEPCWEHNWHDSQEPAKPAVVAVQFDIKQESQSGITIKFDIAVSGRFILLKLGSYEDCNTVDVQTVLVTGYAGPRFFPAVQMR